MGGGLCPLAPPTGVAPLDPVCFWIEDSCRNSLALNGISAINPTRFFEKIIVIFRGKIFWGGISQEWGKLRGGTLRKKMKTYKMRLQNKPTYEISSKSNNGKVVKYTRKIFWGKISQEGGKFGGQISRKKNENLQISIQK